MNKGENRYSISQAKRLKRKNQKIPCVFISHKKEDIQESQKIAEYLKNVGIDVYLDEYDSELKIAVKNDDAKKVVSCIKEGIDNSTHMLCVISLKTKGSAWVPFEVGYGYEPTNLASLTIKGMKSEDLPAYLKVAPIIKDIDSLNKFIRGFSNKLNLNENFIKNYNSSYHPLSKVMESKVY